MLTWELIKRRMYKVHNNFYLFYVQWAIWKKLVQQLRVFYYFYPLTKQCFTIKIIIAVSRKWRKNTLRQEKYVKEIDRFIRN